VNQTGKSSGSASFGVARQIEVSQLALMGTVSILQPPDCAVVRVGLAAHPNDVPPIRRETGMLIVAFSMGQASDLRKSSESIFRNRSRLRTVLQETVVRQQLREHCEQRRKCLTFGRLRPIKERPPLQTASRGPCASGFRDIGIVSVAPPTGLESDCGSSRESSDARVASSAGEPWSADFLPQGHRSASNAFPFPGSPGKCRQIRVNPSEY